MCSKNLEFLGGFERWSDLTRTTGANEMLVVIFVIFGMQKKILKKPWIKDIMFSWRNLAFTFRVVSKVESSQGGMQKSFVLRFNSEYKGFLHSPLWGFHFWDNPKSKFKISPRKNNIFNPGFSDNRIYFWIVHFRGVFIIR